MNSRSLIVVASTAGLLSGVVGCARLPTQQQGVAEMPAVPPPRTAVTQGLSEDVSPTPVDSGQASPTGGPAALRPVTSTRDASIAALPAEAGGGSGGAAVRAVTFTDAMAEAVVRKHPHLGPMLAAAEDWLGTPYVWGGGKKGRDGGGVDCSYFTWLLARDSGLRYGRYMNTRFLMNHRGGGGLEPVPEGQPPRPGDLLVYGYYDEPAQRKGWHGHVVILIDPTGELTGIPGLVLGAHGGKIRQVAYVESVGYDQQFFREPKHALRAVLRPEEFSSAAASETP